MDSFIENSKRKNMFVLTIVITVIFILINISLYLISQDFISKKIEEENTAFLTLTTHLINENDVAVALEFMEHYSHTHLVELEIFDDDSNLLFSSDPTNEYKTFYFIDTAQGEYKVYIDNTGSTTVNLSEGSFLAVNITLFVIYIFAMIILIKNNKIINKQLNSDLEKVISLIEKESPTETDFNFREFSDIYHDISFYLGHIDLLKEQKELNMKGLAHDIKTPLTIILNHLQSEYKDSKTFIKKKETSIKSINKINDLINELIDENFQKMYKDIKLGTSISNILMDYKSVFSSKNIEIVYNGEENINITWNKRDLTRIIENIVSNAFYYSFENTKLIVNLYQKDNIYIEFISEGINIKESDLTKIFSKGYRVNSDETLNSNGKGIGLYVSLLLLKSINGTIKAESNGNINTFTIII